LEDFSRMHFLITGHTGFKGSWLSLMLRKKGHLVSGISLAPEERSLFRQAELADIFENDLRIDIRNRDEISKAIMDVNPEVIVHLAAQPLVLKGYEFPVETFETNVIGTLNVLEATRFLPKIKSTLIITTDKVYKNQGFLKGYVESDQLGGDDPYSASKAAADLAAQSWIKNYATSPIAIARAGNVIGGGDWASHRLITDLTDAYLANRIPKLRSPNSIRPWQHVLDCLTGYLELINSMIRNGTTGEWNFGPPLQDRFTVSMLAEELFKNFTNLTRAWELENNEKIVETPYLLLDSEKSRSQLNWKEKLNFEESVSWTAKWYIDSLKSGARKISELQIDRFLNLT